MAYNIFLYDFKDKEYIREKSDAYEESPFTKGHLIYDLQKYGYNDVTKNIADINLSDIFSDIIISLDPNIYYPSKAALNRSLKKAKMANYSLRYELPFYIDSVNLDMSEGYLNKMVDPHNIREYIHRKNEFKDLEDLDYIKGYCELGIEKKIFGIFPSRETIFGAQLDCLHIAYTCNLETYIQSSYVVIEFIEKAIELDDPAIIFDLDDRKIVI